LLDYGGKLLFVLGNFPGQIVSFCKCLFLGARYAPGALRHFEALANQVSGEWLISGRKTEVDLPLDAWHAGRYLLGLYGKPLQHSVQVVEEQLLPGDVLFHIADGLFDHLLRLLEVIEDAVEVSFE